eukprot:488136_1
MASLANPLHSQYSQSKSLNKNGYIIIPNIFTPQQIDTMKPKALNLLSTTAFNYIFGGKPTKRINSLLSKTRKFDELLLNKRIIDINNYYLLPKHLLSTFETIEIHPGQTQQSLHMDSGSYTHAQKRPCKHPLRIALIWTNRIPSSTHLMDYHDDVLDTQ